MMSETNEKNKDFSEQEKDSRAEDEELERLAVEALLGDVRRRKTRVERVGPMGWVKERNVNKRFLNSLVLQTMSHRTTKKSYTLPHGDETKDESSSHRSRNGDRGTTDRQTSKRRKIDQEQSDIRNEEESHQKRDEAKAGSSHCSGNGSHSTTDRQSDKRRKIDQEQSDIILVKEKEMSHQRSRQSSKKMDKRERLWHHKREHRDNHYSHRHSKKIT